MKSTQKDLVSIIVPVYNVEKYLRQCIDSIINQTYKNIEIILVDDGSTDNSGKICDEYAKKDKRIKVIHKKNGGLSDARNVGIEKATGETLSFVDSDDFVEEDMIETMFNELIKKNVKIVVHGYYIKKAEKIAHKKINEEKVISDMEAIKLCFCDNNFGFYVWNKIYKKELFEKIRFPKGKNSEDRYVVPRLIKNAKEVYYNSSPIYYYLQRDESIVHSKEKINFDALDADNYLVKYIEENYKELEKLAQKSLINDSLIIYNKMYLQNKMNKNMERRIYKNIKKYYIKIKKKENVKFRIKVNLFLNLREIYNLIIKIRGK